MATFRHGKKGRVTVLHNSAVNPVLSLNNWTAKHTAAKDETTNFESNAIPPNGWGGGLSRSFKEFLVGSDVLDWTLAGHWDAAKNPNGDPPGLYPRDSGVGLSLDIFQDSGNVLTSVYRMAVNRTVIDEADVAVGVGGVVTYNCKGSSNGVFDIPYM